MHVYVLQAKCVLRQNAFRLDQTRSSMFIITHGFIIILELFITA